MDTAGMISVIATASGGCYRKSLSVVCPVIGCLGAFNTGSDTSSNILFGKLQANVAGHIQSKSRLVVGSQYSGGDRWKNNFSAKYRYCHFCRKPTGKEGNLKSAIPYALA